MLDRDVERIRTTRHRDFEIDVCRGIGSEDLIESQVARLLDHAGITLHPSRLLRKFAGLANEDIGMPLERVGLGGVDPRLLQFVLHVGQFLLKRFRGDLRLQDVYFVGELAHRPEVFRVFA